MTPTQARMARAALGATVREVAEAVGLSAMTISNVESGERPVLDSTLDTIESWYEAHSIGFGPGDTVTAGESNERWLELALFQIVQERGPAPTSSDLIAAYRRAVSGAAEQ